MPAPTSIDELLDLVRKSGVLDEKRLEAHVRMLREAQQLPAEPAIFTQILVRDGLLTNFQAEQLAQGKWKRFTLGKYRVLERLGSGGMGSVFLCEHKFLRRRVAVKVLPTAKAADPSSLERFYREGRAVAAVDHANIVHCYDIDQDETLHFIVMEYVDGPSFQEVVRRTGPMGWERACHYISQAAKGLEHAKDMGLVHRDIKPGNVLVDRAGVVKILDMGLARFFNDEEDMLTRKYDENVLGTADYLAPEQADDSHEVDVRADIYSLGGTFYFLLTGRTPFGEGTVPQKLMWHRTRQPKPISSYRNDVPAEVLAILDKMMAKEPEKRFQTPLEITAALAPWVQGPAPLPTEKELPRLSPAASGPGSMAGLAPIPSGPGSGTGNKSWQVTGPAAAENLPRTIVAKGPKSPRVKPASGTEPGAKGATPPPAAPEAPGATRRPAPAGTKPPLAPQVGAVSVTEDEGSPWAEVGPDTADASAKGDTPPLTPAKPRPVVRPAVWPLMVKNRRVLLIASGLALGLIMVALAVIGIVSTVRNRADGARQTLTVGKSGNFASVKDALAKARSGTRILLLDPDHRECLAFDATELTGIQIQPTDGVQVVWSAPASAGEEDALLQLNKCVGFQVKGIHFNGAGRTHDLIRLTGASPGLTLENLTLEGFAKSAVVVANCTGTKEQPVQLLGLNTSTGGKNTDTAILFDAGPISPPTNEHVTLKNCRLDGNFAHEKVWFKKERSNTITIIGP